MGWRGRDQSMWPEYVPVSARREKAKKKVEGLKKKGLNIAPVVIQGSKIANSFWGQAWCRHIESYHDFDNRLPRGRSYVRSGCVVDLKIGAGTIDALVSGSSMYTVKIKIVAAKKEDWKNIIAQCSGQIESIVELLQGKLPKQVLSIITSAKNGLMPDLGEISLQCSCPDFARMCKHLAATLYGVGNRLDLEPELLFKLRQVELSELVSNFVPNILAKNSGKTKKPIINDSAEVAKLFGIEIDDEVEPIAVAKTSKKLKAKPKKKALKTIKNKATGKSKPAKTMPSKTKKKKVAKKKKKRVR